MTGFNYARSIATANRLIAKFGQTVTLKRVANSGSEPWNPVQTETEHPATAVIVEFEDNEIDGTLVLRTDRKALIAKGTLTIEPKPGDRLVVGSVILSVVRVAPLNPGGTVVMYEAQVRA